MHLKCAVLSQSPQQTTIRFATSVELSPGYRWYQHADLSVPSQFVEAVPIGSRKTFRVQVTRLSPRHGGWSVVAIRGGSVVNVPNVALVA